jgi:hypothetical protein
MRLLRDEGEYENDDVGRMNAILLEDDERNELIEQIHVIQPIEKEKKSAHRHPRESFEMRRDSIPAYNQQRGSTGRLSHGSFAATPNEQTVSELHKPRQKRNNQQTERVSNIRFQLEQIYRQENPSKLHELDSILAEWKGQEAELLAAVQTKYYQSHPQQRQQQQQQQQQRSRRPPHS